MRRHQQGVALLMVLWATALLGIMLAAFAVSMRTEGLQARYQFDQVRARYAAEAGLARAVYGLTERDMRRRWVDDGRAYRFDFDRARVTVRLYNESGKVDLNTAAPPVLTGLFRAAGLDPERAEALSEAVQDWRDPDNAALPNGAERAQYHAAGRDDGPRNGPFQSIEELQRVLGMTPALYARVAPAITIWSGRTQPDPLSAPQLALQAIPGMDAQRAANFVGLRQQRTSALQAVPFEPGMVVSGGPGGRSDSETVQVQARLSNGVRAALHAVIRLDGNGADQWPYSVLHWAWANPGQQQPASASRSPAGAAR